MAIETERSQTVDDPSERDASPARPPAGAPSDDLLADQQPPRLGRYVVLARVGAGAMGVVYAAYDPQLDRKVAVKLLHGSEIDVPRAQLRLLREARALAKLSHPNVVAVHDVDSAVLEGGDAAQLQVFMAMEFVDGETLRSWLASERAPDEVLATFVQAARGLAAAHAAGLVHRDFKPDNVLVDRSGRARVMDFGLARALDELAADIGGDAGPSRGALVTRRGNVVGTSMYMAPEQHLGAVVDARADQFAFCVALWEALFGERPFAGRTRLELAEATTLGRLQEPRSTRGVTARIRRALERGLSREPDARWPSMDELANVLARAPTRRGPVIVAALTLGAAAVLGVLVRDPPSDCGDRQAQLGDAWDDRAREAVHGALLATAVSYADETWTRVEAGLDAYADAWMTVQREACEGADAGLSDQLRTSRALCIADRKRALATLVDVLSEADADTVEHAVEAVRKLPRVESCTDLERLAAAVAAPDDPETAATVEALRERLDRARALYDAGAYADGLAIADPVADEAEATGYRPLMAEALLRRGQLQEALARYADAEVSLQRSYVEAVASGHDDVAAAAATSEVFVVGEKLARPEEGLAWGLHADAQVQRGGGSPEREATLLAQLGLVHDLQGDFDAALDAFGRALAIYEEVLGADHPDLGRLLSYIGSTHRERGDYAAASEYQRRAIKVLEEALGRDHPRVAAAHNNLGTVCMLQGEYDEAVAQYEAALAIVERALGPDHPTAAAALQGLGMVYAQRAEFAEAQAQFERALAIRERVFGPDHIDVAQSLTAIGNVEQRRGRYGAALDHYRRALAILERTLGPEHGHLAAPLNNIASIEHVQGADDAALDHYRRALAIQEKALGTEHPNVASTLNNLGGVYSARGDFDEARACHTRALAIREKVLGPDHPSVAQSILNIGNLCLRRSELDCAIEYYERGLAFGDKMEPSDRAYLLHSLGVTQLQRGHPELAKPVLEEALAMRERLGVTPTDIAESRFALGRAIWPEDPGHARALAEQAHDELRAAEYPGDALEEVELWLGRHARQGLRP